MTTLAEKCAELSARLATIKTELHEMPTKADAALLLRHLSQLLGQDGVADGFEQWAVQQGLISKSFGIRSESSHLELVRGAYIEGNQAARAPLLAKLEAATARIGELEVRNRILMGERDDAVRAMEFAQEREAHARAVAGKLPPSNSPEAQGAIDAVMESRGWPCSPAAAARAGFEAAFQVLESLSK